MRKLFFALLFVPGIVWGQASSSGMLLKETTRAYLDAGNLSMDVDVHTYSSKTDAGVLLGQGQIRKSGENYYSKFLDDELIINSNCTVVLDHAEKTITWYDTEHKKKQKVKNGVLPDMDSIRNGDSVVYKGVENGQRHFLFHSRKYLEPVYLTEVFINDNTHFVERIVYFYRDNSNDEAYDMYKVVIDYTNISTQKPEASFFSERKWLSYSKGQPVLAPAFSKYKLIIAR